MQVTIGAARLELVLGDITDQDVDVIVNAANSRLAGGGGVDGAVHRRGGPSIMEATNKLFPEGCPTGSAVMTPAGDLLANYVIHAVGPVWNGGRHQEAELLASAYLRCLELAVEHGCESMAFPSLSTGAYRYPLPLAAKVALNTVAQHLHQHQQPHVVRFVLWGDESLEAFLQALAHLEISPG